MRFRRRHHHRRLGRASKRRLSKRYRRVSRGGIRFS